jgi:hypothetical protein
MSGEIGAGCEAERERLAWELRGQFKDAANGVPWLMHLG